MHIFERNNLFPGVDEREIILFIERYLDLHTNDRSLIRAFITTCNSMCENIKRLNTQSINSRCLKFIELYPFLFKNGINFSETLNKSNLPLSEIEELFNKTIYLNYPEWIFLAQKLEPSKISPKIIQQFEDIFRVWSLELFKKF